MQLCPVCFCAGSYDADKHPVLTLVLSQVLGMLLLGAGVTAVLGSKTRNTHMVIASLTLALVGLLLAFEFVAEVRCLSKALLTYVIAETYSTW